jgi:hypothetical protein
MGRLQLPDTVCIDSSDGSVDDRCTKKTYVFNTSAPTDASTNLLNLNLPYNPHYPSNDTSQGSTTSGVTPATVFTVCGGAGNSRNYQVSQRPGSTDITNGSCPTGANSPGAAIISFMGTAPTGAFPSLTGGTGLRSASLVPNNTGTNAFVGLNPIYSGDLGNNVAPNTASINLTLTARNTYGDNRVHVFNLRNLIDPSGNTVSPLTDASRNLGALSAGVRTLTGKITFRANCADPTTGFDSSCTPSTSITRGPSPVFIMMADSAEDVLFNSLRVELDGVNPNNIFWVFPKANSVRNLTFAGTASAPNVITGNFIGTMPASGSSATNTTGLTVEDEFSSFRGVRFLGFRPTVFNGTASPVTGINPLALFTAMTAVDQPALLPVLQLHVPNATGTNPSPLQPGAGTSGINGIPAASAGQWTIRPTSTEVNVYFVAGSTPSRNGIPYTVSSTINTSAGIAAGTVLPTASVPTGETGGGLANFVRFLENWENVPAKITGGFIQNTKSRFATAPFAATGPLVNGRSDIKTIFMNPAQPTAAGMSGFELYYQSRTGQQLPYYTPPLRLWGYDVGLLTQQPDRFAERFAVPIPGSNEFFREISGDDPWVEALLCALEPNDPTATTVAGTGAVNVGRAQREGTTPTNYVRRALRGKDRRSVCDTLTYGATTPSDTVPPTLYE